MRGNVGTVELYYMKRWSQITCRDRVRKKDVWKNLEGTRPVAENIVNLVFQWYDDLIHRLAEDRWPNKFWD